MQVIFYIWIFPLTLSLENNLRLTEFLIQFILVDSSPPVVRVAIKDIEGDDRAQNHLDTHAAPLKSNLQQEIILQV